MIIIILFIYCFSLLLSEKVITIPFFNKWATIGLTFPQENITLQSIITTYLRYTLINELKSFLIHNENKTSVVNNSLAPRTNAIQYSTQIQFDNNNFSVSHYSFYDTSNMKKYIPE